MPLKIITTSLSALFFFGACTAVKYNAHVSPDGSNGFLRTYYSSEKEKAGGCSDGTGIEQCKIQGADVICKDLNIILPVEKVEESKPVATAETKPDVNKVNKAKEKGK
ncbi:MAG TPA: hypothetical protein PLY93_12445 [Turneriella sp.]|nr:hypothetical protein [Turneriella sp.]